MAVAVAVTAAQLRTTAGTQDITVAGFGTPKAAIFILAPTPVLGQASDHAQFSIGATDGAASWCAAVYDEHGRATSDTYRVGISNRVAASLYRTGTVLDVDFDAWITDGVRVNVSDPDDAHYLIVVLFGGDDLEASCHYVTLNTAGVAVDVTAPGFEPDLLFGVCTGHEFETETSGTSRAILTYGWAKNNNGTTEYASAWWSSADDTATSTCYAQYSTAYLCGKFYAGAISLGASISDWDASGYSMTPSETANNDEVGVLALKFNGAAQVHLGTHDTPTATGDQASTAPGFQPSLLMFLGTIVAGPGVYSDAHAGTIGIGVSDGTRSYCASISSSDGATPTDTQSLTSDQIIDLPGSTGGDLLKATLASFDPTGWTLNFSKVPGTSRVWPVLAIGASATNPAEGSGDLAATGTTQATGYATASGSADLAGAGSTTGVGYSAAEGSGTVDGTGALAATGYATASGSGDLAGTGTTQGTGYATASGSGDLAGTGALESVGYRTSEGAGTLDGTGTLDATGEAPALTAQGYGDLSAVGSVTAVGYAAASGSGTVDSVGQTVGTGYAAAYGSSTLDATGTLSSEGDAPSASGSGSLGASGSTTGVGYTAAEGSGDLAGVGALAGVGYILAYADGSLDATGTIVAVGEVIGLAFLALRISNESLSVAEVSGESLTLSVTDESLIA